ncbi:putative helicase mov-10-B.1 isoform X2 [Sitodiplosis mosellana]|uniref:putative helicase mov-10-B.1 isoform X2 n=1 Tax=Sitodiplosis mosellana TaxID=263140 RepID=UPI002445193E|nr:putative helicase mov-10-B.1 isoform X2 [Sitodiplosis mosellana]
MGFLTALVCVASAVCAVACTAFFVARSSSNTSSYSSGSYSSGRYSSGSYSSGRHSGYSGYYRQSYQSYRTYFEKRILNYAEKDERKKKHQFLQMEQLKNYPIPGNILNIQKDEDTPQEMLDDINTSIAQKSSFRNELKLYIEAYNMMVFFEEAVDELKIRQYDRKRLKLSHTGGKEYCITLGPGADELLAAIDDSQVNRFKLISKYGREEWDGKINRKESNKIYVHLFTSPKQMPSTNELYDISFKLNQTVYQLQHNAIDYITKHGLFDILINNPMYHTQERSIRSSSDSALTNCNNDELNIEQRQAVNCIVEGKHHPIPYLLYGPPGTGKTKVIVAAIKTIVRTTVENILVCAQSNAACDEIANRLCQVLNKDQMMRMYSTSYDLDKISSTIKPYCNLFDDELRYPALKEIYKFRVVICTLSTSGCLSRARVNVNFKPDHFGYVIIDECASAHETMALIPIAGLCTSIGKVHAKIILCGDPKQLDAVTKSDWSTSMGFKISWFEQLFKMPLYKRQDQTGEFNKIYITQLVRNYRSHKAILKVPNTLFYENQLQAMVSPDIIELDVEGLLSKKFPIIFRSIQGICRRPENETSSYNLEEVNAVMELIAKLLKNDVDKSDIGIVSPYKLQCRKIRQECNKMKYIDITIGSAEVFQGQERKVMIMSTVRAGQRHLGEFLSNAQRFNVMLTRAQSLLIIVGDPHLLYKDPNWSVFIRFCMKNRCLIQGQRNFYFK